MGAEPSNAKYHGNVNIYAVLPSHNSSHHGETVVDLLTDERLSPNLAFRTADVRASLEHFFFNRFKDAMQSLPAVDDYKCLQVFAMDSYGAADDANLSPLLLVYQCNEDQAMVLVMLEAVGCKTPKRKLAAYVEPIMTTYPQCTFKSLFTP